MGQRVESAISKILHLKVADSYRQLDTTVPVLLLMYQVVHGLCNRKVKI